MRYSYALPTALLSLIACTAYAQFGQPKEIVSERWRNIQAFDVDEDGDEDLVFYDVNSRTIHWYEQTSPTTRRQPKPLVSFAPMSDFTFVDVDADGHLDIAGYGGVLFNHSSGNFSFCSYLGALPYDTQAPGISPNSFGDVDGDGLDDFLYVGGDLVWMSRDTVNCGFGPTNYIASGGGAAGVAAFLGDLDGDSDLDAIHVRNTGIEWYANNGFGAFGGGNTVISALISDAEFVDFDGDGLKDLFYMTTYNSSLYFRKNSGAGGFFSADTVAFTPFSSHGYLDMGDIDLDGDPDILITTRALDSALWIENLGGGSWSSPNYFYVPFVSQPYQINCHMVDMDGDMDVDLLCNRVLMAGWLENVGGTSFSSSEHHFVTDLDQGAVDWQDYDGDGSNDILISGKEFHQQLQLFSSIPDSMHWSPTTTEYNFRGDAKRSSFDHGDLDNDGDLDFITSLDTIVLALYRNQGQMLIDTIATNLSRAQELLISDINADGFNDILYASETPLVLHQLLGSSTGTFAAGVDRPMNASSSASSTPTATIDHDGDGDRDYLFERGSSGANKQLLIFENINGSISSNELIIQTGLSIGDLRVADIDNDGDEDIIALIFMNPDDEIWVFENDGVGNFSMYVAISGLAQPWYNFLIEDVNGDSILDVLANEYGTGSFIRFGHGQGVFDTVSTFISVTSGATDLAVGDVDRNGVPDVIHFEPGRVFYSNNYLNSPFNITGLVYLDLDSNGVRDPMEPGLNGAFVDISPMQFAPGTFQNGYFTLPVGIGQYTVNGIGPFGQYAASSTPSSLQITANSPTAYVEIPVLGSDTINGTASLTSTLIRCSTDAKIIADIVNQGSRPFNCHVVLDLDSAFMISNTIPQADSIVNNSVFWNIDSVLPGTITPIHVFVTSPGVSSLGSTLANRLSVEFFDMQGTLIDLAKETIESELLCAYDPNDKLVSPIGHGVPGYIDVSTAELDYTVRFQNTGNDTAFTVTIEDPISTSVDIHSCAILGSSHTITRFEVDASNRSLVFRFDNILLPDSATDLIGSQGYVKFRLKLIPDLSIGNEIENQALIYFDFNPPIVTDPVLNTIVDCALWNPMITDISSGELGTVSGDYYQWFLNGTALLGENGQTITPMANGNYTVSVVSLFGCEAISSIYTYLSTSLPEYDLHGPLVYPNPATNQITLILNNPDVSKATVRLYTVHGSLVRTWQYQTGSLQTFQLKGLSNSLYSMRIESDQGEVWNTRLLISK